MRRSMVFEGVAVTLLILLAFLMLAMLMDGSAGSEDLNLTDIKYTYTGEDNTLYVFSSNAIYAIDSHGSLRWNYTIPGQWRVSNRWAYAFYHDLPQGYIVESGPIIASDNDILFIYMKPREISIAPSHILTGNLTAISRNGKVLWSVPVESQMSATSSATAKDDDGWYADVSLTARNGRVYVFHYYNETVIDARTGAILWNVANVSDPGSVDEKGRLSLVKCRAPSDDDVYAGSYRGYLRDYRVPSGIVEAYSPEGTLYWHKDMGEEFHRSDPGEPSLPVYYNGIVYVLMNDTITTFDDKGWSRWTKVVAPGTSFYGTTPFDSDGNAYLQQTSIDQRQVGEGFWSHYQQTVSTALIAIGPGGKEISRTTMTDYASMAVYDGVGYVVKEKISRDPRSPDIYMPDNASDLETDTLYAYDLKSGKELWQYTFNITDPLIVTLNQSNVRMLVGDYLADEAFRYAEEHVWRSVYNKPRPINGASTEIYPGKGMIYVKFQSLNFDEYVIFNKSKYAYYGGIYAFDKSGRLVWHKPIPVLGFVSIKVTPGGTIFYTTQDGRLGITGPGAAAGFTLTAALYIFIRFLFIGSVARARSRLNKNDNRNRISDFIARNPGSTLYEISRGMGMNMGTIRYHLLILGLNHRIVASRADGKYIRYFTNSGAYGAKDRLIISLMRRGAMGKVLGRIYEKRGVSNAELARDLGMPESVVFRRAKELIDKGIVHKGVNGRECEYTIEETCRERVARAMERIKGGL